MHNPHNKTYLFIHAIWSVKHREPVLAKRTRETLFTHMRENAAAKEFDIIALNGVEDHVHCLFQLHPAQVCLR